MRRLFGFGPDQTRVWKLSVRQWVWVFVLFSIALQLFIAILSALEFRQQAGDLAIEMQAFSNTGNGRFFWTTLPYLRFGTVSLLNVHFSWVYLVIQPFYKVLPSASTLFVIQAVVIAIAAVPLEALATDASGSPKRGLLVAGLYLIWAPMYAGMPNSFHLEAFLPVQFFSLVLVWRRQQYVLGLAIAALAGFTLDVAPILTALLSLVFLTYPLQAALRVLRQRPIPNPNGGTGGVTSQPSRPRYRFARVVTAFSRLPAVRAAIGLLLLSVVTFYAMRYLEADFAGWLGFHGTSLGVNRIVGFSFANFSVNSGQKIEFWLLLLATLGFLPLLYPRILIVLVPWIGYTFFEASAVWYSIPSHYMGIDAVPLFIGAALGIGALPLGYRMATADSSLKSIQNGSEGEPASPGQVERGGPRASGSGHPHLPPGGNDFENGESPSRHSDQRAPSASFPAQKYRAMHRTGRARVAYVGSILLIAGVLVANVAINPVNPLTAPIVASAQNPLFQGSGGPYSLTLTPPPGYNYVVGLAGQISPRATVLVDQDFMPLVSSDPNAYAFNAAYNSQFVPFNYTNLPEYVLSTRGGLGSFNHYSENISVRVWNNETYGVEGWVQSTTVGSVFLFERGYTGPTRNFGPISYPQITFKPGVTLVNGPAGTLKKHPGVPQIVSLANKTGRMWMASDSQSPLPEGNYNLSIKIQANGTQCATMPNGTTLLNIEGNVTANTQLLNDSIPFNQAMCGPGVSVHVLFHLQYPVAQFFLTGIRPTEIPLTISVASVTLSG